MGTLNGINYEEIDGSNRLAYSPDGIVGTRIFQVAWDERIEFAQALLGYTNAVGDLPIRTDAQTFPGYDRLYCRNATVVGLGQLDKTGQVARYDLATITAEYRPWSYSSSNVEDDDYDEDLEANMARWEEVHEYGVEVYSTASGEYYWSADPAPAGTPIPTPIGFVSGVTDYTYTSSAEPELRRAAIRARRGTVNDAAWMGAPAGYVLFMGASARRTVTSEGVGAWEITYRFRELDHSWNEFHGRIGGVTRWEAIEDEHGNPPYASTDFGALFV